MKTEKGLYHYRGCALPNVYLSGGYEIQKTPYGEGIVIHNLEGLHAAIGSAIVANGAALTGAEFRFLRQELELSQASLGALIGCDEQTVARWEKGNTKVNLMGDKFLRVLYQQAKMGAKPLAPALKILQDLECRPPEPKNLLVNVSDSRWEAQFRAKSA